MLFYFLEKPWASIPINLIEQTDMKKDFFNCYLVASCPTLGHYQGESLTHQMLITALFSFNLKITGWVPKPGQAPSGVWTKNLRIHTKDAGESDHSFKIKCSACKKGHDLKDCLTYLTNSLEDRSRFLLKGKLCYDCLKGIKKEHTGKTC